MVFLKLLIANLFLSKNFLDIDKFYYLNHISLCGREAIVRTKSKKQWTLLSTFLDFEPVLTNWRRKKKSSIAVNHCKILFPRAISRKFRCGEAALVGVRMRHVCRIRERACIILLKSVQEEEEEEEDAHKLGEIKVTHSDVDFSRFSTNPRPRRRFFFSHRSNKLISSCAASYPLEQKKKDFFHSMFSFHANFSETLVADGKRGNIYVRCQQKLRKKRKSWFFHWYWNIFYVRNDNSFLIFEINISILSYDFDDDDDDKLSDPKIIEDKTCHFLSALIYFYLLRLTTRSRWKMNSWCIN